MKPFIRLLATLSVTLLGIVIFSPSAGAADKNDFNPGYIIDDYVFYNSNAMDANQIQNFLNAKNPNCDYSGTQSASDWGFPSITHAQFAQYKREGSHGVKQDSGFHTPPYKCLTMYTQNTPQMEAASGYCSALSAGTRSAAQIINDIAKACGINPQVLIILLEKEQSLITDKWPLNRQLQNATGFACPDTAPCDPAYEGFFYQVYYAARQFKVYKAFPNNYNYRAGRNNNIYWNPDLSRCGSSSVYIQNQATAALYIYTPYRPNQAALDNLYGTGDSCSSYGNRNFWRIFTDWFGSTKVSYQSVDNPRWMVLTKDSYKINPGTGDTSLLPGDLILPLGTQLKFTSKVYIGNEWYFRTEYDTNSGLSRAIPASAVSEIQYQNFETPRWMTINKNTTKFLPTRTTSTGEAISKASNLRFVSKIQVNGMWYFRTEYDTVRNNQVGIPSADIEELHFVSFETPRVMEVIRNTHKIDASTNSQLEAISKGVQFKFTKKVRLDNLDFYQAESDTETTLSIAAEDIRELAFTNYTTGQGRWMITNKQTKKMNPITSALDIYTIPQGQQVFIVDTISSLGIAYLRTSYDKDRGSNFTIPAADIEELNFVPLDRSRMFEVIQNTTKYNPITETKDSILHFAGEKINFSTKVFINGKWYLRSSYDTINNNELAIPLSLLGEV